MTDSIFSRDQLAKIVAETLPSVAKLGEKVVVGTIDQDGVQVVASFRNDPWSLGEVKWELQAAARHEWSGDSSASAKVLLRW